jgi:hypothetical protein
MAINFVFLSAHAILLILNIIFTLKAGKKDASNELTEIKYLNAYFQFESHGEKSYKCLQKNNNSD